MTYILNPTQESALAEQIRARAENLAALIARGINATSDYTRPGSVSLIFKIQRNPDEPRLIEVVAQEKRKAPRSKFSDVTEWGECEVLVGYRVDEDPGQTHIGDVPGVGIQTRTIKLET